MNRLREILIEKNIQQKEVALAVGVSRPTVSNWVKNKDNIKDENLHKLAEFLGVDWHEIVVPDEPWDVQYPPGVAIRKAYQPAPAPAAPALSDADIAAIAQRVRSLDDAPAVRLTPAEQQFIDSFRLLSTTQKHRVQAMIAGFLDARELSE